MSGWRVEAMAELPQRHTIRWQGYDYAQAGAYYLTICTDDRRHWFGHIWDGVMHPSAIGQLARRCWNAIPEHMPHVDIGEFVVMPNHVHGIVIIRERLVVPVGADHDRPDTMPPPETMPDDPGTGMPGGDPDTAHAPSHHTRTRHDAPLRDPRKPPGIPRGALGQIVASYKSAVTRMAYRDGLLPHGTPIWQRNYWDRVIRDDGEHERIAQYIRDNPMNWERDRFRATHR
jgi:REP element-mobilizing transposase RayT